MDLKGYFLLINCWWRAKQKSSLFCESVHSTLIDVFWRHYCLSRKQTVDFTIFSMTSAAGKHPKRMILSKSESYLIKVQTPRN